MKTQMTCQSRALFYVGQMVVWDPILATRGKTWFWFYSIAHGSFVAIGSGLFFSSPLLFGCHFWVLCVAFSRCFGYLSSESGLGYYGSLLPYLFLGMQAFSFLVSPTLLSIFLVQFWLLGSQKSSYFYEGLAFVSSYPLATRCFQVFLLKTFEVVCGVFIEA